MLNIAPRITGVSLVEQDCSATFSRNHFHRMRSNEQTERTLMLSPSMAHLKHLKLLDLSV